MTSNKVQELLINMEELIFRVASVVVKYSPAAHTDMQLIFDEWAKIMKDILEEK